MIDCLPSVAARAAAAGYRCIVSQPGPGSRLTVVISIISAALALLSAAIAAIGVRNSRLVARQKATLDLIEKVESTDHYRSRTSNFTAIRRADRFDDLIAPANEEDRRARLLLIDYLNHYELIALGIRTRILDGPIYREWMGSAFVADWNSASGWIQRQRWKKDDDRWVYDPRPYRNFQLIAESWSTQARHLDRTSSPEPTTPGSGDSPLPHLSPGASVANGGTADLSPAPEE